MIRHGLVNMSFALVVRINLAWSYSFDAVRSQMSLVDPNDIFIDIPIGRSKSSCPDGKIEEAHDFIDFCNAPDFVDQLKDFILSTESRIKYVAVSNVEYADDMTEYIEKLPSDVVIVPKIETVDAVANIDEILFALPDDRVKMIMLDHDDMYLSFVNSGNESRDFYTTCVKELQEACDRRGVKILRTVGVAFSD
jgi:citrate lyase beta subunit